MKTVTYDETQWKLVPAEPTKEMEMAWRKLLISAEQMAHASHVLSGTPERNRLLAAIEAVKAPQPAEPMKTEVREIIEENSNLRMQLELNAENLARGMSKSIQKLLSKANYVVLGK